MKTTITSQALQAAIIKYLPQPWTRAVAMHLALAGRYDVDTGSAACTQEDLAKELKVSPRTIKTLNKEVRDSGLWIFDRGNHIVPSTYTPSKRLIALVRKDAR